MSPDFDELVETSTSLGEAATEGERLTLHSLSRSSNDSAMPEVIADARRCRAARRRHARGEAQLQRLAPRPRLGACSRSPRTVSERLFGEPPVVTAIHAGLETAVIGSKVSGHLDMLAIGPQIEVPHSPDERVSIPTVERFWKLLVGVVDELSVRRRRRRDARTAHLDPRRRRRSWSCSSSPRRSAATTRAAKRFPPASGRRACAARSASGAASSRTSSTTCGTPNADSGGQRGAAIGDAAGPDRIRSQGSRAGVEAADTLVVGIDDAGIPDTAQGEEAADAVSDWADSAQKRARGRAGLARR